MSVGTLANNAVDIESVTETKSAIGGMSKEWAALHVNIPARVTPLNGESVLAYAKQDWTATHAIYFEDDFGIEPNVHRLTYGGEAYYVKGVEHFRGGSLEHWKVIAERKPNS